MWNDTNLFKEISLYYHGWISYFCHPDSLLSTQSCVNNPIVIIGEKVNSNYNMIPLFLLQFLWLVLKNVSNNNLCYVLAPNAVFPVLNVLLILKGLTDRHSLVPNNRGLGGGDGGFKNKGGRRIQIKAEGGGGVLKNIILTSNVKSNGICMRHSKCLIQMNWNPALARLFSFSHAVSFFSRKMRELIF